MPRVTPSKEEVEYLKSIGVLSNSGDTRRPVTAMPPPRGKRTPILLFAVSAVIAALLLLYAVVHAQEEMPMQSSKPGPLSPMEGRSDSILKQEHRGSPDPATGVIADIPSSPEGVTDSPAQQLGSGNHDHTSLEVRLRVLEKRVRFIYPLVVSTGICVLVAFLSGLYRVWRHYPRGALRSGVSLRDKRPADSRPHRGSRAEGPSRAAHKRPALGQEASPERLGGAKRVIGLSGIRAHSSSPEEESRTGWETNAITSDRGNGRHIGFHTVTGPVRSENEDACLGGRQGDREILVAADGLGGLPGGGTAARIATIEAARVLSAAAGMGYLKTNPQACIEAAFRYASNALFERAMIPDYRGMNGLRTTLIIVVCEPAHYFWGYQSDGGIWIRRRNGSLEKLMIPQKASGCQQNILAASLGPDIQGRPRLGKTERKKGDLLFVGTDGVFDRVEDSFADDVAALAMRTFRGELQRTVEETLDQLASAQDKSGFLCDDNMTLALVSNGIEEVRLSGNKGRSDQTEKHPATPEEDRESATRHIQSKQS